MFFNLFFSIIIIQRLAELYLAKKNERWMKQNGGEEYGVRHYQLMVMIHSCFFLSLLLEVFFFEKTIHSLWIVWLALFVITQLGRIWVIYSLGKYWNTKIIVLPSSKTISKGPYKYLKHPNYLIVTLELLIIPLMFNAYITLICFFILNQLILAIRIPYEEKILAENTDYAFIHNEQPRYFPKLKK